MISFGLTTTVSMILPVPTFVVKHFFAMELGQPPISSAELPALCAASAWGGGSCVFSLRGEFYFTMQEIN